MNEKIGRLFPKSYKILGYTSLIIGGLILLLNLIMFNTHDFILGLILFIIGHILVYSYQGIEIIIEKNIYRKYITIIGIKFGKNKDLSQFIHISIIKAEHGYKVYGRSTNSISISKKKYDVCLFNESFRKKELIKICDTEEEALSFSEKITLETGLKYSTYNPPISQSTLNRKNNRR